MINFLTCRIRIGQVLRLDRDKFLRNWQSADGRGRGWSRRAYKMWVATWTKRSIQRLRPGLMYTPHKSLHQAKIFEPIPAVYRFTGLPSPYVSRSFGSSAYLELNLDINTGKYHANMHKSSHTTSTHVYTHPPSLFLAIKPYLGRPTGFALGLGATCIPSSANVQTMTLEQFL